MSYPGSGLRSDILRAQCPVTKVTSPFFGNRLSGLGLAGFHRRTTRRLPVAAREVPISYCRDGFPRPIVFKEPRDEHGHDGGLQ
jgi:hypothetical protein